MSWPPARRALLASTPAGLRGCAIGQGQAWFLAFGRLNTSISWGLQSLEPKLGAAPWTKCPKAQSKGPERWQQGARPLCQLIPRDNRPTSAQKGYQILTFSVLGRRFKGPSEALHFPTPSICSIRGKRATTLHLHGWPLSTGTPTAPGPVGLAALMGSKGTQGSAPRGRALNQFSMEAFSLLGARDKSMCFEYKYNRSNIKYANFQTEQEGTRLLF